VGLKRLDHVALWVSDRDAIAGFAAAHLGMHVIERTDRFTLIGSQARHGKLTLFEAEGPRQPGALAAIGLRVSDLDAAVAALPAMSGAEIEVGEGLRVRLVEAETDVEYDLDHVALWTEDPAAASEQWQTLGFHAASARGDVERVEVAGAWLELWPGGSGTTERPLLNHLGVLVDSAEEWMSLAESAGAGIADVVDAPNTYAVFVWGPEDVKLEYVEHKPSFSLE
jgi:catechol 2,3-dioxygenase-like lactoylglutathione lyase family enzyme